MAVPVDAQNESSGGFSTRICFRKASSSSPQRKPGGWKTMPYILGLSLSLLHSTKLGITIVCSRFMNPFWVLLHLGRK